MSTKREDGPRTEVTFRLNKVGAETKKSVRDALKNALAAEIKKDKAKSVIADHSSAHSSGHSSAPSFET